ncbi:MAG: AbrB/MazE/SpoVT family DNA-binding domain-containing protein [Ruminococcaceae bacterium]|nr:AbrB/MazE/SpoVT family DNA-binding domain-containing protein [Oscillospiraceae bacterium]
MKSTGIVRKIDALGRIVLPIELRKHMDIATGDDIEIFVEGNSIILEKYSPACIFCFGKADLADYEGKCVCKECREKLASI